MAQRVDSPSPGVRIFVDGKSVLLLHSLVRCAALFLASWAFAASAQTPEPPAVAARAYLLMDVTSGQLLAEKDSTASVEPASLTKLMSAYLVFDALKSKKITLTQTFGVSERAWKMPGSRMFIDPKMQVPVEDLVKGMIVQSGNDATVALAEGVGGTVERFVQMMNEQAKALGMKATVYKNPEGLTEAGHTTTAADLAILAIRLMQDFPEYVRYYAVQKYRYPGSPATNDTNRNLLLFRDPTVDGLKTGHTEAAGYCLVATAKRDVPALGTGDAGKRRLLSVVLGAASENARSAESQKLLSWGYTAFEAVRLFQAGQAVQTPRVWKGRADVVKIGRAEGVVVTVPAGEGARLKTEVSRPDPLVAPLRRGQPVGVLRIATSNGAAVAEVPLSVLEPVEESGFLGRVWDSLRLWIQ